jgi:R3H domain
VATVIDGFLRGKALHPELRIRTAEGGFEVRQPDMPAEPVRLHAEEGQQRDMAVRRSRRHMVRIFPYAVNRNRLEQAIQRCRAPASLVEDLDIADLILTLKSQEKHQSRRLREAQARGVPLYIVRHNTVTQMEQTLRLVFDRGDRRSSDGSAMREAEAAIREVLEQSQPVELTPQNNYLRRLQHQLADRYGLTTESKGVEPHRRVVIYPV